MGRPRKDATPDTPPKKERLTLTQLAGYDDILTDALVDHVRLARLIQPFPRRSLILHLGVFLDYDTKESI